MTDSETLRAAAKVLKWRTNRDYLVREIEFEASQLDAADRAELLARKGDIHLSEVASDAWHESGADFLAVARAVREAIEAEQ